MSSDAIELEIENRDREVRPHLNASAVDELERSVELARRRYARRLYAQRISEG